MRLKMQTGNEKQQKERRIGMKQGETLRLCSRSEDVTRAGEILRGGGLVGIPTETVYGLAANALDAQAVGRIFAAKGRPQDNPLIVHVARWEDMLPLVTAVPEAAKALARDYWPGPLTMILPRSGRVPAVVSAGLDTVAIRMPSHPAARAVILAAGVPLAAPSANRSGSPSPTTAQHVLDDLDGRIEAVLDGGVCSVGLESTVVDLTHDVARLLRPGAVTVDMLRRTLGAIEVDDAVTHRLRDGAVAASPGMKYKHYAPKAPVTLVCGTPEAFAAFVNERAGREPEVTAMCFDGEETALQVPFVTYGRRDNAADQAQRLFDTLRALDERGAKRVYAACPSEDGVGLAVYNRLLRAAGFEVIHLD